MAGGVYIPDDGLGYARETNEGTGTSRNRRELSQLFKKSLQIERRSETQPGPDDTMRLMQVDDTDAPPLPNDANGAKPSTSNGYWQSFVENARKKSWYKFSPSAAGAEGRADGIDSEQVKQKDRVQFLSRRNARNSNSTMQNVLKRKIYVSSNRAEELRQLQQQAKTAGRGELEHAPLDESVSKTDAVPPSEPQSSETGTSRVPVLLIGFTDAQVEHIQEDLSDRYCFRAETFIERDWVALMKTSAAKFNVEDPVRPPEKSSKKSKSKGRPPQIVAIRFTESEVTEFQRCCIATQFMASRIVAPVVDTEAECRPEVHEVLATFMQETWPVHSNVESFCQFCKNDVPGLISLRQVIQDDIRGRIQHLGKVNYLWHGAKRVPVSFVPFGVSAVNFLGLSRLVAKILLRVGMLKDSETKKAGLLLAGQSYAKVFILDNLGDLYQLTAAGAVVASLSSALMMGEGLAVAVGALSFSDFALLGSASIVTGAVAAIGAALTRPEMVESLCLLTATLQTLWCVFPQTRRRDVSEPAKEMTPEQKATAERLAQLTMMPSNGAANVASSTSAPCLVQELCKADMDNTLQLLLDEEEFLDAPECSGPAKTAAAPDPAKAKHSLSQRSL